MTNPITKSHVKEDISYTDKMLYTYFIMFISVMITTAFLFNSPAEIIKGILLF